MQWIQSDLGESMSEKLMELWVSRLVKAGGGYVDGSFFRLTQDLLEKNKRADYYAAPMAGGWYIRVDERLGLWVALKQWLRPAMKLPCRTDLEQSSTVESMSMA